MKRHPFFLPEDWVLLVQGLVIMWRLLGEASEKHLQANFSINTRNQNVHSQLGVAVVALLSSNSLLARILLPVYTVKFLM